ncbi:SAM-dependent methyltransferase [Kribbella soli]|uniref:SAM-dependent methyltransferase n=1 Tax=Kribbella soli TaxID=1124743 RepID=A0A4R0HQ75_9ACTN|nr:SAM-dependent methyltransferase [Kribbella soli]TCC11482.1 SAM-dependent methyltransferase [Kribbella soli]
MAEEVNQGSEEAAIPGIDLSTPSIARAYDYMLGGKDNFAVDRALVDQIMTQMPGSDALAKDNRGVLVRAIREIVENTPVRQFLDLGSGLPTAENVHQVAQRRAPESKVVYVDNDPIVLAHGRALLAENANTVVFQADLRDPKAIYDSPDTRALIDFEQPVAIILSAILHHLNDDENPADLVRFWYDRVPSGSYFFVSHFRSADDPRSAELQEFVQGSIGRGRWRSDEEILALLPDGLTVLPPGLVPAAQWRTDLEPEEVTPWGRLIGAVLAVKP